MVKVLTNHLEDKMETLTDKRYHREDLSEAEGHGQSQHGPNESHFGLHPK